MDEEEGRFPALAAGCPRLYVFLFVPLDTRGRPIHAGKLALGFSASPHGWD